MGEVINGVASEYEIIKVKPGNISVASDEVRVPTCRRITYEVTDDGILKVETIHDQYDECMYATSKTIITKDAFIDAYKKYIVKNEDKE